MFSTPFAGSLMLLRTRGRKSGLMREAPLGYLVRDGAIYCVAGFGASAAWHRNILADPHVECVLPAVSVSGLAEVVTDPVEWAAVYPALVASLGIVGRITLGDVQRLSPDDLARQRDAFPLVRIRPTGLAPGAFDPGGLGWVPAFAIGTWLTVRTARFFLHRRPRAWLRRMRPCPHPPVRPRLRQREVAPCSNDSVASSCAPVTRSWRSGCSPRSRRSSPRRLSPRWARPTRRASSRPTPNRWSPAHVLARRISGIVVARHRDRRVRGRVA